MTYSQDRPRSEVPGPTGAVRRTRTSLNQDSETVPHAAQRPRHSARASVRLALEWGLLERLCSVLKWLVTEARREANFCRLCILRNRSIARSLRRNGSSMRRFRISAAKSGPNLCHQNRTVAWLISWPRSCSRSSTFRSESGNRTYIMTARRMISCEVLKYLKGPGLVLRKCYSAPCPAATRVPLTLPAPDLGAIVTRFPQTFLNPSIAAPQFRG